MNALSIPTRTAPRLHRPVPVIGWGAFKIGRNQGAKYPAAFRLPSEAEAIAFVHQVIREGVRLIDTAPAYGSSEERLGKAFATLDPTLRAELFVTTKVGERFVEGASRFDFSPAAVMESVEESFARLNCDALDAVFVHSDGSDAQILQESGCVEALHELKKESRVRNVGFSSKTFLGGELAIKHPMVDAVMLEVHPDALQLLPLLPLAHSLGKAIFVKKPLASGTLDPKIALPWILAHPQVTSVVVGGLDLNRLRENLRTASLAAS
ncbi:MAG: aldo/keto reductase [Planctomycetes bacterium]|nr:aldo/keto reductase [Planctomycetota bacterium]